MHVVYVGIHWDMEPNIPARALNISKRKLFQHKAPIHNDWELDEAAEPLYNFPYEACITLRVNSSAIVEPGRRNRSKKRCLQSVNSLNNSTRLFNNGKS